MAEADGEDAATDAEDEYLQEIAYVFPEVDDTTCSICHAEFLDSGDLDMHVNQVHKEFTRLSKNTSIAHSKTCQFCDATYAGSDAYAHHVCDEHLIQLFCCRVCTKCFTEAGPWKRHERKHASKNNTFACSQCTSVFSSVKEVEVHEIVHHDNKDDGVFLTCLPHLSALLKLNIISYLQSSDRALSCISCKFTTEEINSYLKHFTEKCVVYVCDICCFVTHMKKNLIKHVRKKNKCELPKDLESEMTKCITCKSNVHCRQMQSHISVCKKYKCYICDIRFKTIESLSAHQTAVHPVELDVIKCRFCTKEFVGQISLEKHMKRSHSHQYILYKYKCMTCEQIFKHPQLLFAHYFTRHKELEPYTCKICNLKFRVRKRFTIHIKMVHKSVGVVEFDDQYQVFFAEKKSENPFIPKCVIPEMIPADSTQPSIKIKTQKQINEEASKRNDEECLPTETDMDDESTEKPKRKSSRVLKRKRNEAIELTSSDEEEEAKPLSMIKKRAERKRFQQLFSPGSKTLKCAGQRRQLTCKVCNKYCYTYQNYQNHIQLHKRENIKCIKCSRSFKSKTKLSEHMAKDHASSKLTETLKHVLERKQVESGYSAYHDDRNNEELTPTERFMKTIKKVKPDRQSVSATITRVSGDVSVRKFIENFVPDIGDTTNAETTKNIDEDKPVVTIKHYDSPFYRKNMIKLSKFTPEPPQTTCMLKMPVKFKAPPYEQVKLKVKLVQEAPKVSIFEQFDPIESKFSYNEGSQDDGFADNNDDSEDRSEVIIPEVAEEVMLEGSEDPPKHNIQAPHKIVIPKLPEGYPKIHIATLQPQAPYYKIITVKNAENANEAIVIDTDKVKNEKPNKEPIKQNDVISLPDGSKFVTANPLAHLLGGKPVEQLLEPIKNKYYKPPVKNFQGMFAEALQNLEKPVLRLKRQRKKPENEGNVDRKKKSEAEATDILKNKGSVFRSTDDMKINPQSKSNSEDTIQESQVEETDEVIESKSEAKPGKSLPII